MATDCQKVREVSTESVENAVGTSLVLETELTYLQHSPF